MYPYPKEIVGDVYLSRLGGFSDELGNDEIGINEKALEINTSIIAGETMVRLKFFDRKDKPYFLRKEFTVLPISPLTSASELSKYGEIVMSTEHIEKFREDIGKAVLINSVESFRLDGDYSSMKKAIESMREWIWRPESLKRRN